jgi:hypothetical protein
VKGNSLNLERRNSHDNIIGFNEKETERGRREGGGESEIIKKGEGEEGETDRQITSKRE